MIQAIGDKKPQVDKAIFVALNAVITGDVCLAEETSVWFNAVLRGDLAPISVGYGSNIQDGSIIHVDDGVEASIGRYVTVGHGAIIHGCTGGDECVIGMGAIILNNAQIPSLCFVGAGALVTEGKRFPSGTLILGAPAKVIRDLTEAEREGMRENARHYIKTAASYKDNM